MGAELFHADGQTDRQTDRQAGRQADRQAGRQEGRQVGRHEEAKWPFSQFCEKHLKVQM